MKTFWIRDLLQRQSLTLSHFLDGARRTIVRSSHFRNWSKHFDYHHISKSPAVFDITKLRWMNGEYIKKMDPEEFYEKALPYMKEVLKRDMISVKLPEWYRPESRHSRISRH